MIFYLFKKRGVRRTDIVLAGLCDSGKTLLFSILIKGKQIETFTSLKENTGFMNVQSGLLRLVDMPGHERLRLKLLDTYKKSSKALVYVIDSCTVQKEIKDVAE